MLSEVISTAGGVEGLLNLAGRGEHEGRESADFVGLKLE